MNTSGPHFTAFCWVEKLDAYRSSANALHSGTIPVLQPTEPDRRRRWTEVLEWYGLTEVKTSKATEVEASPQQETDPIFVFAEEYMAPMIMYASWTGRPAHLIKSDKEPVTFVRDRTSFSILIVDKPQSLRLDRMRRFNDTLGVPWGVLTARDLPGLTFALAKLLAQETRSRNCCCAIDMMAGTIRDAAADYPTGGEVELTDALVREHILARDWDRVAIVAHGEGAHVNLESVVLCGLSGPREQGTDGLPIDGCTDEPRRARRCKRVHDPTKAIVSFGDVRTKELYLFSCNGFSVSGEMYPSDVSALLACAEGHSCALVTTDRPIAFEASEAETSLALRGAGMETGILVQTLNDFEVMRSSWRPYVLWGDPRGRYSFWTRPNADGTVCSADQGAAQPIELGHLVETPLLSLEGAEPEAHLVRGVRRAVVIRASGERRALFRLVDSTDRWTAHVSAYRSALHRLHLAGRIERAIRGYFRSDIEALPDFFETLTELMKFRLHTEFTVQAALGLSEQTRRGGVYGKWMEEATDEIADAMGFWDRCFGRLALAYLLREGADRLQSDGSVGFEVREADVCRRCGSPIIEHIFRDLLISELETYRRVCLVCGFQASWTSVGGRLQADMPTLLIPGEQSDFTVSVLSPRHDLWSSRLKGDLIVAAKDKGSGDVFFKLRKTVQDLPQKLAIPVPQEVTSDLHTVKAIWIKALDVSFLRMRRPAIVRPKPGKLRMD